MTIDQIFEAYLEHVDNPLDDSVEKDEQVLVFTELAKVEGFDEFLRMLMGEDVKRYFKAQDDTTRASIKGAFGRVMYFRAVLKKVRELQDLQARKAKRTETVA